MSFNPRARRGARVATHRMHRSMLFLVSILARAEARALHTSREALEGRWEFQSSRAPRRARCLNFFDDSSHFVLFQSSRAPRRARCDVHLRNIRDLVGFNPRARRGARVANRARPVAAATVSFNPRARRGARVAVRAQVVGTYEKSHRLPRTYALFFHFPIRRTPTSGKLQSVSVPCRAREPSTLSPFTSGSRNGYRTSGSSKSVALKTPNSRTSQWLPALIRYRRRLSSFRLISASKRRSRSSICIRLTWHSNTDFCTRCPVLSHTLATRRSLRRPALVSVFTS